MKRYKNHLIAAAVLSVLAIIGTMMNSRPSVLQAAGGPTVTIDPSQLPLPVQGSLGITGTANVKVTNPAAAPVLSLNVNDPGRTPYHAFSEAPLCPDMGTPPTCSVAFQVVPTSHRLVIQHISILAFGSATTPAALVEWGPTPLDARTSVSYFPTTAIPGIPPGAVQAVDQAVLGYFDAGQQPGAVVAGGPFISMGASVTGYMLDCTIAPCAAIAK
jgi:hypothetical protein